MRSTEARPGDAPLSHDGFIVLITFALCLQWAFSATNYSHLQLPIFVIILGAVGGIVLSLRRHPGAKYLALTVAIAVGIGERMHRKLFAGSDVVDATREALNVMLAGQNPYFHFFMQSRPAGSPFPYMPGELAFYGIPYMIFHSIAHVDQIAGIGIVLLIASLAPIVGVVPIALSVTLFSTFSLMANVAVDGSNENGLALVLTAAFALYMWSDYAARRNAPALLRRAGFYGSAVLFTTAVLFKALAWFFVPFFAVYLVQRDARAARRYGAAAAIVAGIALVPFLWPSPSGLVHNIYAGFIFHHTTWGLNIWNLLAGFGFGAIINPRFAPLLSAGLVVCIFGWLIRRPVRSVGTAVMYGLAVLTPALLCARWTTAPYFTFAATMLALAIPLLTVEFARE